MTQYIIDIGAAPNDGQGDPLRTAFDLVNLNFDQIWNSGPVGSNVVISNSSITTAVPNGNLTLEANGIGRVVISSSLNPNIDNIYDLGAANLRFRNVYVGTGGIWANGLVVASGFFYANGAPISTGSQGSI